MVWKWFQCDCIFLWLCFSNVVWAYMCCWCVCHILFDHLRYILECCHMIYFGPGIILMCVFSFPFGDTIFLFFNLWHHMGQWFWYIHFYFPNIVFGDFSLFGVTVKCWLLIGRNNYRFFLVHWLEFIWLCLHNRYPQMFCIVDWIWLRCHFHLGSFLVHLLEFLLAYLPDWHTQRYCWKVCLSEYIG